MASFLNLEITINDLESDLMLDFNKETSKLKSLKINQKIANINHRKGDFTQHHFATSNLMSTYLFSFVAGNFSKITKNPGKFGMRFLYRENKAEKIAESVLKVVELHQKSLSFLEAYTQEKFPFQKMDFAIISPFQYGEMEHVGAIPNRESSLFLNMHHPLRQKSAVKQLKSVLYELEEVQLKGDVFFPKGWLASSFGNYSSKEANKILQGFLTENPKYNPILLKKIQQTTDNLKRAQSIKK